MTYPLGRQEAMFRFYGIEVLIKPDETYHGLVGRMWDSVEPMMIDILRPLIHHDDTPDPEEAWRLRDSVPIIFELFESIAATLRDIGYDEDRCLAMAREQATRFGIESVVLRVRHLGE